MPSPEPHTYIHGAAAIVGWRDESASLTDLIFRATSAALNDSGVPLARIHSVVLSAHDLVDGRSLSSMVTAPAAGAYLRDEIRLAEDGLAALSLAAARIEAGEVDFSIVAAWGRASECDYMHTSRAAPDPFLVQPFGLDEFGISALRLSAWAARHGERAQERLRAADAREARVSRPVQTLPRPAVQAPLAAHDAPRFADMAFAAVVGRAPGRVRLAGFGHSAERPSLGDRDLVAMPAMVEAVERATRRAGVETADCDLYQLAGPTLAEEAIALEALGLAAPGEGFSAYARRGDVNPAGGSAAGWCFPTGGLANVHESWLQLTGRAGDAQLKTPPRRALATGLSPMGGQVAHAAILEAA